MEAGSSSGCGAAPESSSTSLGGRCYSSEADARILPEMVEPAVTRLRIVEPVRPAVVEETPAICCSGPTGGGVGTAAPRSYSPAASAAAGAAVAAAPAPSTCAKARCDSAMRHVGTTVSCRSGGGGESRRRRRRVKLRTGRTARGGEMFFTDVD